MMITKRIVCCLMLLAAATTVAFAQDNKIYNLEDLSYSNRPTIEGHDYWHVVFAEIIAQEFKLPKDAQHLKTRLTATISFVVERNGKVSNVNVTVKPYDKTLKVPPSVAAEMKRLATATLDVKFTAGKVHEKPVRTRMEQDVFVQFTEPSDDPKYYEVPELFATSYCGEPYSNPAPIVYRFAVMAKEFISWNDCKNIKDGMYRVLVEADGRMSDVLVGRSCGDSKCDEFAKAAIEDAYDKTKLCPAINQGKAVRSQFFIRIPKSFWQANCNTKD